MGVAIKFAKTFTESAAFKKLQAEQTQIFEFWDQATLDERAAMVEQLATLPDWTQLRKAFDAAMAADAQAHDLKLEPLDELRDVIEPAKESELWKRWYALGMQALSKCECAVVTLAGGQGTRLGSSRPKGCYSIGLPSGASLFELQAKRIRRLGELTNSRIRWYVMTSQPTHQDTVSFFREHAFFGLDDSQVVFFQQGLLPAFTNDGDLILQNRNSLAVAPDGNGGIYRALEKEGILADMELHGVKFVHMYCVDNCLVKVGDPVFIGACIEQGSDCAAKCVEKLEATESVGVFCRRSCDGKIVVAEYSEIDPEVAQSRNERGHLLYGAANIANHYFTVDFLKQLSGCALPYHVARKKISSIDTASGEMKTVQGVKLEAFIFDVFELARKPVLFRVNRDEEFAPLKNAPGTPKDSPEACALALSALHRRYLEEAGGILGASVAKVEISPTVSYQGENLEQFCGVKFTMDSVFIS